MQKSIFVCVLALSLCLTATARPDGVADPPTSLKGTVTTAANVAGHDATAKGDKSPAATTPGTSTGTHAVPSVVTTATPATTNPADNTKPSGTTSGAPTVPAGTTTPTPSTSSTTTPKPPSSSTQTPAPTTTKTSVSTTEHAKLASTTAAPVLAARGFDGASFIGGIVLALGLLAIGFMGFKYYKTQTERNYHTL